MRSNPLRLASWAAALVLAAAPADATAKPRRIVIVDFDGQRALADTGRNTVLSMLGEQYDVVATKRWEAARAEAQGHGPRQWSEAAKQVGVDAVIEGWVQDEGRHHVLTVLVRDAATGNEVDEVSVPLGAHGIDTDASHQLAAGLDDMLAWVDSDPTASDTTSGLPEIHLPRGPRAGHHVRMSMGMREPMRDRDDLEDDRGRGREDTDVRDGSDGGRDRAEDDDRGDGGRRRGDRERDRDDGQEQEREREPERERDREPERDRERDRDEDAPRKVAKLDADTSDLVSLFGPDSKEAAIVSDNKTVHVAKPTPRFEIAAGGYLASRGMSFEQDPNSPVAGPEYPASSIKGLEVNAAVYPLPVQKTDGGLSGIGFSFGLAHSVGSVLTAMDQTGFGDYTMEHTAWELGIHYRWPFDIVAIDGEVSYGNVTHAIIDLPESIQIPDTSVSYLGAGAHIDLKVTDRSSVRFGAKYLYVLDSGDIMSEDWYGAGGASGIRLDGSFVVPLTATLFARGGIEYERISYDFEGSGMLAQQFGMWSATDSSIAGTAQIGVQF